MSPGLIALAGLAALATLDLLLASRTAERRLPRLARDGAGAVRGPLAWVLVGLVRLYRAAWSARNAGMCRFEPSCSAYALAAVRRHGGVRGGLLAAVRILRCQPLSAGGYDPVPRTGWPGRVRRRVGTDPGAGFVRRPEGATGVSGTSPGSRPTLASAGAARPAPRHGNSFPDQGARGETGGSGRGPWV